MFCFLYTVGVGREQDVTGRLFSKELVPPYTFSVLEIGGVCQKESESFFDEILNVFVDWLCGSASLWVIRDNSKPHTKPHMSKPKITKRVLLDLIGHSDYFIDYMKGKLYSVYSKEIGKKDDEFFLSSETEKIEFSIDDVEFYTDTAIKIKGVRYSIVNEIHITDWL